MALGKFTACMIPINSPRIRLGNPPDGLRDGAFAYTLFPTAGILPELNVIDAYIRFDLKSCVFGGRSNPSSLLFDELVGSLIIAYESKLVGVDPVYPAGRSVPLISDSFIVTLVINAFTGIIGPYKFCSVSSPLYGVIRDFSEFSKP